MASDVPHADELPDALTERDQWLCWREEDRSGKPTKVPINPHTGSYGSATDPDSWAGFETARAYAVEGAADGLGFVFTDDDPLVGVDLDDCRDPDGEYLIPDARDIIEELASFTEISPSGTGVHVLVEGELHGDRNRRGWIECYETARYFTVTGDHLDGTPLDIEERTSELHSVSVEYLRDESQDQAEETADTDDEREDATADGESNDSGSEGTTSMLSDEELIDRAHAAANGEKFARLWNGDTSGYESHSEADMALCALLSFWTGGDAERIDRLFRQSGLMREKWDERHYADGSTYGEVTIERVVASTDEVYDPDGSDRIDDDHRPADETDESLQDGAVLNRVEEEQANTHLKTTDRLAIIAELQNEAERLEEANVHLKAENQNLRQRIDELEAELDATTSSPDSNASLWNRVRAAFAR